MLYSTYSEKMGNINSEINNKTKILFFSRQSLQPKQQYDVIYFHLIEPSEIEAALQTPDEVVKGTPL